MIERWLTKLFGTPEEINGANRCPTYMYRWTLAKCGYIKVYLHKFVGDDWSLDLHDHPKRFISIGLWGEYKEQTPNSTTIQRGTEWMYPLGVDKYIVRRFRSPWFPYFSC